MSRLAPRGRMAGAALLALAALAMVRAAGPPKNDFRFCILGDRTGNAQDEVYERVWSDVDAAHPDFVINAGDTIQGGNDATAAAEWQVLRKLWNSYPYRLYFTPGNHDIWSPKSRKVYEQATGRPAFYGFNYQGAHFTVLDNSQTENLSNEQMEFLERDLAANRGRDPKFVFFHKPFWLIPVAFQNSSFPFHRLARKYGVRYVISGHTHRFARVVDDGIVYLEVCSSGGKLKGQGFAGGWLYGSIIARVEGSKVSMTVKEIDGPLGKGRRFTAEDWGRSGLAAGAH